MMDINTKPEEVIVHLENEIVALEKEVTRASTAEYKNLIQGKLHADQLMLKESLLRITIVHDNNKKCTDNSSDKDGPLEDGELTIEIDSDEEMNNKLMNYSLIVLTLRKME
jgi:hypothetical protein